MRVMAFGMWIPLNQFLTEVAPMFLFPMWPLLLAASVLQIVWLYRAGAIHDRRAWKFGFVVLLSPLLAVVARMLIYLLGIPDYAPFAHRNATSQYVLTLTANSVLSVLLAHGGLGLIALLGRPREMP